MNWRDSASPLAQNDLDSLFADSINAAGETLRDAAAFDPFMLVIGIDGQRGRRQLAARGSFDEASIDDALKQKSDGAQLRARATIFDVTVREPIQGDAIKVKLEHREGVAIDIVVPYSIADDAVAVDVQSLNAATASPRLWV